MAGDLFLFASVVVDFYAKDYCGTGCGYDIGDNQREVADENALNGKEYRAGAHGEEGGQGNAVGVASANSGDCLWQITANHAD